MTIQHVHDTVIHLPENCPACYAPILKWQGASVKGDNRPIRPETASYDCGLSLVHQGSVKNQTASEPCSNAYVTAVSLRKAAP